MYLIIFVIFVFGLLVGSFLNCVIYRLEKKGSFLRGRSFCPYCKHVLDWKDLIPLLSFLVLKGRCQYCHQRISWQYPLIELATGILFFLIAYHFLFPLNFQNILNTCYLILVTSLLIIIFVYDLKHYIIPDKVLLSAIGIVFLYRLFETLEFRIWNLFRISDLEFGIFKPLIYSLIAGLGTSVFFLVIFLISKGKWMGLGDAKLVFLMSLFLGFPNILVALFLSFFFGAIIGIGLIGAKKKTLKSELPFGPFLITGTFIALFWGKNLINWYLNLFI